VNKSTGIHAICDKFGIDREEAIAFGDSYNDMGMFRAVGRGYAMENAKPELKDMAYAISQRVDQTVRELFQL
jgi:hypothetical protein